MASYQPLAAEAFAENADRGAPIVRLGAICVAVGRRMAVTIVRSGWI